MSRSKWVTTDVEYIPWAGGVTVRVHRHRESKRWETTDVKYVEWAGGVLVRVKQKEVKPKREWW
jgi:hypothetical protein